MWAYIEKTGLVVDRPATLVQIVPCVTAGELVYDFAVYNGKNDQGDVILEGEQLYGNAALTFYCGVPCSEGIFVTVGTNLNGVLVIWE